MVFQLATVVGMLVIVGFICFHSRGFKWRLKSLASSLPSVVRDGKDSRAAAEWLRNIYRLIRQGLTSNNNQTVYGAADLLKLAIGEGIVRSDESSRLSGAIVSAIMAGQPEFACFILDAYRPLIRQQQVCDLVQTSEQLNLIGTVALKERRNSVAARAAEYVFVLLDRAAKVGDVAATKSGLQALAAIGIMSLRRQDDSLFREICVQLEDWATGANSAMISEDMTETLVTWIHKIIGQNKLEIWVYISTLINRCNDNGLITMADQDKILQECLDAAGAVSLNLANELGPLVLDYCLDFARRSNSVGYWRTAIAGTGKIISVAVGEYGLSKTVPLLAPLFSNGCRLMHRQIRSSYAESNTVNMKALHLIVRECLMVLEIASRKDMTISVSTLAGIIVKEWPVTLCGVTGPAMAKFCQMLILYRSENRRKTKRTGVEEQSQVGRLSNDDQRKFYFLRSFGGD